MPADLMRILSVLLIAVGDAHQELMLDVAGRRESYRFCWGPF